MSIQQNVKSLEELPEVMREFVEERDGAFFYDAEKAFNALVNERNAHRDTKRDQIGVEKCKQPFPILWDEQKKFFG
jgi:hypothetical protein